MSKLLALSITLILIVFACQMGNEKIVENQSARIGDTEVLFLNRYNGFEYLMNSSFVNSLSLMDFSVRMKKDFTKSDLNHVKHLHQEFLENEVLNWSQSEVKRLLEFLNVVIPDIEERTPQILQDTLVLIKTSGKEEFNAFYTCEDAIVFPKTWLTKKSQQAHAQYFTRVLYHELFHIFTRNNYDKHPSLYQIVGFHPQEYSIPDSLEKKRITNPDFSDFDYLIDLELNTGEKIKATILTYYKSDSFNPNFNFSDIIGFGLFPVSKQNGTWSIEPWEGAYKPIPFQKFSNFYSQVGKFTDYYLGAEEILADGYSMKMIDIKYKNLKNIKESDSKILSQLIKVLQKE